MKRILYYSLTLLVLSCSQEKTEMIFFGSTCDSTSIQVSTYKELPATKYICYSNGQIVEWITKSNSLEYTYSEQKINQFFTEKTLIEDSMMEVGSVVFVKRNGKLIRNHNFHKVYINNQLILNESRFLTVDQKENKFNICFYDQQADSIQVFLTDSFPNIFELGKRDQQIPVLYSSLDEGKFCFEVNQKDFDKGYLVEYIQSRKPGDTTEIGTIFIPRYFDLTMLERIKNATQH